MHTRAMNDSRPAAAALMACLGEESRFRLVQALIGGARCVTDLAAEVGLSQSCTTRHLQALERRQVVRGTREGKRVLYRIREDDPALLPLLGWALSQPAGAAGVRARRVDRKGAKSLEGRRPYFSQREAGSSRRFGRTKSAAPTRSRQIQVSSPSSSPSSSPFASPSSSPFAWPSAPPSDHTASTSQQLPAPLPPHARRRGGSDIEDYLL